MAYKMIPKNVTVSVELLKKLRQTIDKQEEIYGNTHFVVAVSNALCDIEQTLPAEIEDYITKKYTKKIWVT